MTGWMTGWMTGVALPTSPGRSPPDLPTLAARSGTERRARLDLGAWELGGDVLGLLQDRVEIFCLDEFVGLPMLEGPDAAHRQAGRGRRPGIGEIHDDEPVVLAKHQIVGLKFAPPADSTALDTTVTRSLGCSMARAMASPLRVKNTASFDIAATLHQRTLGSLHGPLVEGYVPRTRPTSEKAIGRLPARGRRGWASRQASRARCCRGPVRTLWILGRRLLNVCLKFSVDEVESGVSSTPADTLSDQPLSEWPAGREADRTSVQRTAAVGLTDRGSQSEFALMADRPLRLADDGGLS